MANAQTRRRRKLGVYLQELRKNAGRSLESVADLLGVSRPTVTRMEGGYTRCRRVELHAILGYYGADERQRSKAVGLWDDASDDATWVRFPARSSSAFRNFLQAEAEATTLQALDMHLVPGLLQTLDYARAVQTQVASPFEEDEETVEQYVRSRLDRQRRLGGDRPLELHAFLDEAALRREVGGVEVLLGQLRHLLEIGYLDNVRIQLVPFGVGAYGTNSGGVTILGFSDAEDPPVAYLEHAGGGVWVEDGEAVAHYTRMMRGLDAVALSEGDTAKAIRHRIEVLEQR
ncbi:helix-turn-helix domain-containing protein [Saccharothrix yanglingensis]|uniref:HTH cro/C1-type domain-containing protein n=1 Tax=Saccharothrix yanglingensis TaxID=659496 RepID=A0ABU0X7R9_9PSEU|nr:helix-turn-helix transcriptional regulator [Saccharothrix yanglingensis]MDQ2587657.1 hypothetical protein [Saccharothrix yanglingensis]